MGQMSIKEKLQQIQATREREEIEEARQEAMAAERAYAQQLAEEARINTEVEKVKRTLDSKGITKIMQEEVQPVLHEMLGGQSRIEAVIKSRYLSENVQAVGHVFSGEYFKGFEGGKLGVFIDTDNLLVLHIRGGENDRELGQFSLNDKNLTDKLESSLAEILSKPENFCWNHVYDDRNRNDFG